MGCINSKREQIRKRKLKKEEDVINRGKEKRQKQKSGLNAASAKEKRYPATERNEDDILRQLKREGIIAEKANTGGVSFYIGCDDSAECLGGTQGKKIPRRLPKILEKIPHMNEDMRHLKSEERQEKARLRRQVLKEERKMKQSLRQRNRELRKQRRKERQERSLVSCRIGNPSSDIGLANVG